MNEAAASQPLETAPTPERGAEAGMNETLGLQEGDLWGGPLHAAEDVLDHLLEGARESGPELRLHLAAPPFVALDERAALPVIVAATGRAADIARFAVDRRAILVAVEQDNGFVRVESALVGRPGAEPAAPRALLPPAGFEGGRLRVPDVTGAWAVRVNLESRLAMPWPPGSYTLTVLAANLASRRVTIKVGSSPRTFDPAVRAYYEAERGRRGAPPIWPAPDPRGDAPHYLEMPDSPPVPEVAGIALAATRVADQRAGSRCLVHGSFRLPVPRERIAPPGAVLPITLVITGSDDPTPIVVKLEVPSFDPIDRASPSAVGHFTIDLFTLAPMASVAQTYFVWAFSGDAMTGPAPVAVVSESAVNRAVYGTSPVAGRPD